MKRFSSRVMLILALGFAAAAVIAIRAPGKANGAVQGVVGPRDAMRTQLQELVGNGYEPVESIMNMYNHLARRRENELEKLAGSKAKMQNYAQLRDEIMAQLDKEIHDDVAISEYAKSIAAKENYIRSMQNSHAATPIELDQAGLVIAQLRGAIAEREESIRGRTHGGIFLDICKNTVDAQVEIKQEEATLEFIEVRLGKLREAEALAIKIEQLVGK